MDTSEISQGGLESQLNKVLTQQRDLTKLKALTGEDFNRIKRQVINIWADDKYKLLGRGSSRKAYKIDEDHVLKVATTDAGLRQNQVESHIASKFHDLPITQVHYVAPKGFYLVVDLAHQLNEAHFEDRFGITWYRFSRLCMDWDYCYAKDIKARNRLFNETSPEAVKLIRSLLQHGILLADLSSTSQWGDLKDTPVIIDYGFNKSVKDKFYNWG